MKSFSNLLRETRLSKKITQGELAERAGIDPSYISKIERGIYPPPAREKILAIFDAFEIEDKVLKAYFLLSAGNAKIEDIKELSVNNISERQIVENEASFFFPEHGDIEIEVLIAEVRQLLNDQELSKEQRGKLLESLQSFIEWQKFQLGRDNEEGHSNA